MKTRFTAILIFLCLLIGIVGFSSSLTGALGIPGGGDVRPPDITNGSPPDSPTTGPPGPAGMSLGRESTDTGMTPAVTPTEYMEQDSTQIAAVPDPSSSPAGTYQAAVGSTPAQITSIATTTPLLTTPNRTPSIQASPIASLAIKAPPRETVAETVPPPIPVTVSARYNKFHPSTITVPAGARVTIIFVNQDVGVLHNVAIFTDTSLRTPIFKGKIIFGSAQVIETFNAPSQTGEYVLACCFPWPHRTGSFIVE